MTNRNNTIDIAKGLGIILVVLGHGWMARGKGELFRIIFSFHMPLFFFLAGIFIDSENGIKSFILTKADALLKPYFSVLVTFGLLKFFASALLGRGEKFNLTSYFQGLLYATGNTIASVVLWFLPHLFIASVVSFGMVKILEKKSERGGLIMVVAVLLLWAGIHSIGLFWSPAIPTDPSFVGVIGLPGLPWSADIIPITSAFILFGYMLRDQIKDISFNAIGFMLSVAIFLLFHYLFNETIDLNLRVYGDPIVATLQAFLGIYITLSIATLLAKSKYFAKPLAYIGSGSIFIMIFHVFIQGRLFNELSKFISNKPLNSIISLAVGVLLPLLILECVKRFKPISILLIPHKFN